MRTHGKEDDDRTARGLPPEDASDVTDEDKFEQWAESWQTGPPPASPAYISRDDLIARIAELESAALDSGPGLAVYEEQARQISVAIERIESLEAERDQSHGIDADSLLAIICAKSEGMTGEQIAAEAGVTQSHVCQVRLGKRPIGYAMAVWAGYSPRIIYVDIGGKSAR